MKYHIRRKNARGPFDNPNTITLILESAYVDCVGLLAQCHGQ